MNNVSLKDHPYVRNLLNKNQIRFLEPPHNGIRILCSTDSIARQLIERVFSPQTEHDNDSPEEKKLQNLEPNQANPIEPKMPQEHRMQSDNQDVPAEEKPLKLNSKNSSLTK